MANKLPQDFEYIPEMYEDEYFPDFLVDKVKDSLLGLVKFLEQGEYKNLDEVQERLDQMTIEINELDAEFNDNDSELETVARESIAETVYLILKHFNIDIDIEEAIRERDW